MYVIHIKPEESSLSVVLLTLPARIFLLISSLSRVETFGVYGVLAGMKEVGLMTALVSATQSVCFFGFNIATLKDDCVEVFFGSGSLATVYEVWMHSSISPTAAEFLLHSLFVVLSVFGDKARLKSISRITTPYVAVLRCFMNFDIGSITSVFIWLILYVI